jgi:oligoribonuclease
MTLARRAPVVFEIAARCYGKCVTKSLDTGSPVRRQSATHLAWLDLEMTGLDTETCVILQAALIITDADLDVLEEFVCDVWQPERYLSDMVPVVREMHEATGLLERVRRSDIDVGMAERRLLERVSGWCGFSAVLCGNSIGSDRRFVERHMPGLACCLHYRMIDVSAVKVLAGLWYGEGAMFEKPEVGKHDALVDIKNSIAELAHYRATLFRSQP